MVRLFNAMIRPLIPFTIKGVIWYQGETNRSNAHQYKERFSAKINSWRTDWSIGDLPFYFAQIAPFEYSKEFNAAYLREAQLQTMQQTAHKFHPAKAEIIKGKLTVYSENVSTPVAVRYGWENYTEGTLFNLGGLPASSFRTDNW